MGNEKYQLSDLAFGLDNHEQLASMVDERVRAGDVVQHKTGFLNYILSLDEVYQCFEPRERNTFYANLQFNTNPDPVFMALIDIERVKQAEIMAKRYKGFQS